MGYKVTHINRWHPLFVSVFAVIVCGAIALPMLPIWQGAIRVLAGVTFIFLLPVSAKRISVGGLLFFLLIYSSVTWLGFFLNHPFGHVIHALTDIYGQPLNITSDTLLLLFDVICVTGLSRIAIVRAGSTDRMMNIYIFSLLLFWLWSLITPASAILSENNSEIISQMLTGSSVWSTWAYWALVPILIIRNEDDIRHVLKGAGTGGVLIGIIVAIQWLTGDYSYVLDSLDFNNYFFRVRGTDYYHASASFAMAIVCGVLFSLVQKKQRGNVWLYISIFFLLAMVAFNNTRAISLAMLAGMSVVMIGGFRQKQYIVTLISIIGFVLFSSSVFYVKPVSGETTTVGVVSNSNESKHEAETKLDELSSSNESRVILAFSGIKLLPSLYLTGSGVGTLKIPLVGNAFNGMQNTYSSHILYLDILLMAGFPALIGFAGFYSIAFVRVLKDGFFYPEKANSYRAPGLLAALVIFAIASLFLPQERNELIGISILFTALALLKPGEVMEPERSTGYPLYKEGCFVIVLGTFGWAFLTSPSYIFPALEFTARFGQQFKENENNREKIFVNEPVMKPVLEAALFIQGVKKPEVIILEDNKKALPKDKAWIIWSPKRDVAYPDLRKSLGYQRFREGGKAPSLKLLNNWWLVSSFQPVVHYIYVGARSVNMPLSEIARVTKVNDARLNKKQSKVGIADVYTVLGKNAFWMIYPEKQLTFPVSLSVEAINSKNKTKDEYKIILSDQKDLSKDIKLSGSVFMPNTDVSLKGSLKAWPNKSMRADVKIYPFGNEALNVVDLNYGSGVIFIPFEKNSIVFDFKDDVWPPIGIYRMVALNWQDRKLNTLYSWTVEGSNNENQWIQIDKRNNVELSRDADSISTFRLKKMDLFRYYRFQFSPSSLNKDKQGYQSGLMELELYPLPE